MHSWRMIRRVFPFVVTLVVIASVLVVGSSPAVGPLNAAPITTPATLHEQEVPAAPAATASKAAPTPTTSPDSRQVVAQLPATAVDTYSLVGVTWDRSEVATDFEVEVRWRQNERWSPWTELHVDHEDSGTATGRPGTEPRWVGSSDGVAVRVTSAEGVKPSGMKVATIRPGASSDLVPVAYESASLQTVDVSTPTIIMRSTWGADNSGDCDSPLYGQTTRGAVIHHTAGTNSYTAAESASIVNATQAYHMGSRKWCDIGYNFLVDKYGQIFEGRKGGIDKTVRGAHSGNGPVNEETMGVSLMGTFTSTEATDAMKSAVVDLVSWRFADYGVPAKGTYSLGGKTLNRISGHRNVVSTACPGETVYAWLSASGGLRDRVADRLANVVTEPVRPVVTGLTGSNVSTSQASVSWKPVDDAVKYRIYYTTNASMPSACEPHCRVVTPANLSSPSYRLSGLSQGAAYHVKVSAIDSAGRTITGWQDDPLTVDLAGATAATPSPSAPTTTRLFGADRYATAAAISAQTYAPGFDAVFVATGTGFADGLAGGTGAAKLNAPLLLTRTNDLPTVVANELRRLKPKKIYILGGKAVVSGAVEDALDAIAPTSRLAGLNRYATATESSGLWSSAATVYLASGVGFADALSGGAAAAKAGMPLLLTATTKLPAETRAELNRLKPSKVILVGGKASISQGVEDAVEGLSGVTATRIGGADRYDTSAKLLDHSWSSPIATLMLASGAAFPDALAGVPTSSATGSAFALAKKSCLSPSVQAAKGSSVGHYILLGGTTVLDSSAPTTTCTTKPAPDADDSFVVPSSGKIPLTGHGYGHGIGMGQYGARGAAKQGLDYDEILAHYYPGTKLADKGGDIRVLLTADSTSSVKVRSESGLKFRNMVSNQVKNLPTSIGGTTVTRWSIEPTSGKASQSSLRYYAGGWATYDGTVWTGAGQFEGPSGIDLIMPDNSERTFRGALRSVPPKSGASNRDTVNVLSIESYVRGVVASEMPSSWESEALKAQSVAARTYGVRSIRSSRYYDICDTTSCQVYGGVAKETDRTDAAVAATSGKILTYEGQPALTQFSSSTGGYSAPGSEPYLRAVKDPYDTEAVNPNHTWEATVSASKLENEHPSIGTLKRLRITDRNGHGDWGGRVVDLELVGSKKTITISGKTARFDLGIRSHWFRFGN